MKKPLFFPEPAATKEREKARKRKDRRARDCNLVMVLNADHMRAQKKSPAKKKKERKG